MVGTIASIVKQRIVGNPTRTAPTMKRPSPAALQSLRSKIMGTCNATKPLTPTVNIISLPLYQLIQLGNLDCFVLEITEENILELFNYIEYTDESLLFAIKKKYGSETRILHEAGSEYKLMKLLSKHYDEKLPVKSELQFIGEVLKDFPECRI